MKKAQPSRVYITINNQLVEAILDTGAAVSVISKSLVDKLGITGEIRGKIPISGYGESKSIPCKVITNVDVRIGGRLRREHFCVDESQDSKDVCLLGRTWIKTHDIGLRDKGKVAIVPIKNGTDYIEVACLPDNDESSVTTDQETVPVYQIRIFHNNISEEKNESAVATNQYSKEISTYQEDVISEEYQENEARNLTGGDDEDANGPIKNLVDQYSHCFVENVGLGRVNNVRHEIPTTTDVPIRSKPYRLTIDEEDSLKEELDTLLELGIIRPSNGRWTAPVFFVPKKNKKLRLVVNFQRLNAVTIKDGYPLPHIEEVLDSLGGSRFFSTLDAASGFWQVEMDQNSMEKTGFVTKFGTYEFTVMPFGLTSAPSTFQRMMTNILQSFIGKVVYVFIDDVLVYSQD